MSGTSLFSFNHLQSSPCDSLLLFVVIITLSCFTCYTVCFMFFKLCVVLSMHLGL